MKIKARLRPQRGLGKKRLEEMLEEATVDAYGESEQLVGFYTMIEERVEMDEADRIVAICVRGRERQAIPILDLVLPSPRPAVAEWIEAYRHWACGR